MSTPFWQVWLGQTTNSNPQGSGSDASVNSNVLKQTYINRFLDVSGTFTVRYDASINGNLYLGPNSRLGLGLTAPAYILDQSGTARMQSPNSASYTSSPHANQDNHGLVLTSTKATPGTAYSMGLGIDFSSGAGYITTGFNSSGTPTGQPLILNATGGDVGIGYKNPTAGLFVVANQTVTGSATLGTYDAPAFYGNTVASFLNSVTPVGGGVSNAATIELGALNRDILTGYTAGANTNSVYKYAITSTVNNSTGCDLDIKGITIGSTLTGTGSTAVSRLYISPAGNVGIGTTSPTYTLDVSGTARFTDNLSMTSGNVILNSRPLYTASDRNHGITQGTFADGPHLFGYSGGSLGTSAGSTKCVLLWNNSGNVGIGTTSPIAPLHVAGSGSANVTASSFSWINFGNGVVNQTGAGTLSVTAYIAGEFVCSSNIRSANVTSISDRRIKKQIEVLNKNDCLEKLRKIEAKTFYYNDYRNQRSEFPYYGFIAQEIEAILNSSVEKHTEYISNIYDIADISNGTTIILRTGSTSSFEIDESGNLFSNIKLYDTSDNEIITKIISIIDDKSFIISDTVNDSIALIYGQEVNNFRCLNKDAIFTIATAALQQIDKEFQEAKQTIQDLQTKNADLESRLSALEARLTAAGF